MGWTVWGDDWLTGELSSTALYQTVQFNEDVILRAARTWIIVVNDPVFEDLEMKIYSNEVIASIDTPRKLLHTSTDRRSKSEIHTLPHGVREIFFRFDDVSLKGNDRYNFVINGTGYAPTADSFLCWRKAFPDPVYRTGYTPTIEALPYSPYAIYFIGGDL